MRLLEASCADEPQQHTAPAAQEARVALKEALGIPGATNKVTGNTAIATEGMERNAEHWAGCAAVHEGRYRAADSR